MVDKEGAVQSYMKGRILNNPNLPYDDTENWIENSFRDGYEVAETYYKDIAVKFYKWSIDNCPQSGKDKDGYWTIYKTNTSKPLSIEELFELFLKELENEQKCSKNGIKREGESCTLNNNCIYPKCLK